MSKSDKPASRRTLGEYVELLEKAGKLVRVTEPVNKDTELHPLVRLQFRGLEEKDRKAFLFENVVDVHGRKYDIPVLVGAMAGSDDIYALGMDCNVEEINDKWDAALKTPIPPRIVTDAPCQEVRFSGDELTAPGGGLGRLPHPISTPGFDNAPYTTASHWITREPDTGIHNVGNYRGMLKSETRIGVLPAALGQGMRRHIDMWRAKGETRVPAAIVIGAPPYVTYASCTRIPNEVCEYDVAGSLYGEPLEVTRCLTHDLLVPAESEIVIEGWVTTDELEVEGPFGEFPGYMAKRDHSYFMEITCITMRKKPIYLSIISQMPPSESSKLRHVGRNAAARSLLRKLGFDNVIDVNYVESSGSYPLVVVKLKKKDPEDTKNVLQALIKNYIGKVIIAVDDDINIYNMEHIMWAVSYRAQPYRDIEIIDAPLFSLDPSVAPSDVSRNLYGGDGSVRPRSSALVIDATMKWPYPPLSLPKREFMEGAIKLWEKLQLPELHLRDPWFGYSLGYWTDEEAEEADLAVQGRHYETGEKLKKQRRPYPL